MKWMITGAKGQLGQDLQKECRKRGGEVLASDISELDITDLPRVREAVRASRAQAIVNCSAYNAVDQAETDVERALLVNGIGPRNLAIAAEEQGIPLMHFSTDYVFDGAQETPYTIADPPRPISQYGSSKLLGEQEVRALCRRHFVVRLSWVFGAGNTNFAAKVLEWARGKPELKVVTDQVSCPCYTADLAPAILDLFDRGAYGLLHLTNQGFCSRFEWAEHMMSLLRWPVRVLPSDGREFPTKARRPAFSAMNSAPIENILGRDLPHWKDAVERYLVEVGALER